MSDNFGYQNRFKFVIEHTDYKNSKIELVLTSVTIPGMSINAMEQPTSIRTIFLPGNEIVIDELIINFNMDENWVAWIEMYDWFKAIKSTTTIDENVVYKNASLTVLDTKYRPIFAIKFIDIFPMNLAPVDMTSDVDSLNVALTSITFKINDMQLDSSL